MGTVVGIVLLANFLVFDVDHLRNWWSSRWFDISKSSIAVDQPPGNTGGPSFHWLGWSSISAQTFWIGKNGRVAGSLRKCPTPPQPFPLLPLFALQLSRIGNVICLVHKTFLCQKKPTITKQSQTHFFSQIKVEWLPPLPSPLSPVKTISSLEPDQTTYSPVYFLTPVNGWRITSTTSFTWKPGLPVLVHLTAAQCWPVSEWSQTLPSRHLYRLSANKWVTWSLTSLFYHKSLECSFCNKVRCRFHWFSSCRFPSDLLCNSPQPATRHGTTAAGQTSMCEGIKAL